MPVIENALFLDTQKLSQTSPLIDLFEIDLTSAGGNIFRFTNSVRFQKVVKFKGKIYYPIDFETSGWEVSTGGTLPTPSIKMSNISGVLTGALVKYNDLLGLPLKRIKTYEKYIDQLTLREEVTKTVDQSQNIGLYDFGTYYTGRDGVFKITVAQGQGIYVDFIVVNGVQYNAQDVFEDPYGVTSGTWYPANVDTSWDDTDTWDDSKFWNETNRLAYFSDVVGSSIEFKLPDDVTSNIIVKVHSISQSNSNMEMNLKTYNSSIVANINFSEEEFVIDQKVTENRVYVEFKMTSYMDKEGAKLPNRRILKDYCPKKYRVYDTGTSTFQYFTCPYNGTNYFNAKGEVVLSASEDRCNKKFSNCRLRFGTDVELPYGGWPGVIR